MFPRWDPAMTLMTLESCTAFVCCFLFDLQPLITAGKLVPVRSFNLINLKGPNRLKSTQTFPNLHRWWKINFTLKMSKYIGISTRIILNYWSERQSLRLPIPNNEKHFRKSKFLLFEKSPRRKKMADCFLLFAKSRLIKNLFNFIASWKETILNK